MQIYTEAQIFEEYRGLKLKQFRSKRKSIYIQRKLVEFIYWPNIQLTDKISESPNQHENS